MAYANGNPDSKVNGANMGPIWGRQDPGGPHVGPIIFAIWETILIMHMLTCSIVQIVSYVEMNLINFEVSP